MTFEQLTFKLPTLFPIKHKWELKLMSDNKRTTDIAVMFDFSYILGQYTKYLFITKLNFTACDNTSFAIINLSPAIDIKRFLKPNTNVSI